MAWRPTQYLIEGELDNTVAGKVTGWMQFASLDGTMTFDLAGDFHRDIRGAKIRLRGDGQENGSAARNRMAGLSLEQTGDVGDITAGREPRDYAAYPYIEWYSEENGRVVIELDADQVEVIGTPIPTCESDPVSREEQAGKMAGFLAGISAAANVPAVLAGTSKPIVSDPQFTHWVVEQERLVGEAHSVEAAHDDMSFAYVRLFSMPELAERGYIATAQLRTKNHES